MTTHCSRRPIVLASLRRLALFATVMATTLAASAIETRVYLAKDGNDRQRGRSEADAVATLERALSIAEGIEAGSATSVLIVVKPGLYEAQTAITRGNATGLPVHIVAGDGGRPVFDGAGKGGTWLTLKPRGGGQPSNLRVQGLEVRRYEVAIDVEGNRNRPEVWAGAMEILNNHFTDIGDTARPGAPPSTAAIRFVNSDRNIVSGNAFVRIRNEKNCPLLHALYVAHGSTDNSITDNSFEDSCGDAVRFRDQSDNNIVRNNVFKNAWSRSPVSDWFCNPRQRDNCTKDTGECPSRNLSLVGNRIVATEQQPAGMFVPYGGTPPDFCAYPKGVPRATIR